MRESIIRIRRAVTDGGLKKSALAKEAGVKPEVLTGVDDDTWNPRARTVESLISALDRIVERLAA